MNRCEEQREREREEKTAQRTYDIFFSCALSRALFFFSLFLSYASTRVGKKKKVKRNDDAEHEPQRASIIVQNTLISFLALTVYFTLLVFQKNQPTDDDMQRHETLNSSLFIVRSKTIYANDTYHVHRRRGKRNGLDQWISI